MSWYRIDDFNEIFVNLSHRSVTFRNDDSFAFIKEIRVLEGFVRKELSIYILPSLRFIAEFNALYSAHFNTTRITIDTHVTGGLLSTTVNSAVSLEKLLEFSKNKQFGIPEDILKEIKNIYSIICQESKDHLTVRHILPVIALPSTRNDAPENDLWNPRYRYTDNNPEAFFKSSLKKVAKELSKGINPNIYYNDTELPILNAAGSENISLFLLLLAYCANPFLRCRSYCYESAFDIAVRKNNTTMLKAITAASSRPEKIPKEFKAEDVTISASKKLVSTHVSFSNGDIIITVLQSAHEIAEEQKTALFDLFSEFFELNPLVTDKKLKKEFLSSISGPNKYIELIVNAKENKLIGFNCFEIGLPNKHRDHLVLHCIYSLIRPVYRGHGLMALLTFRLAFCLQTLLPTIKVAIFFCAVHYNSYRLAERFLHFPKYRSDHVDPLITDILQTFFKDDYTLHEEKEGIRCYLDEEIRVKGKMQIKSDNLLEEFFHQWLLDLKEGSTAIRSAPILFYATQHTFGQLYQTLKKVNIKLDQHIDELASLIKPFFSNVVSFTTASSKPMLPTHSVFWQGAMPSNNTATKRLQVVLGHLK